MQANKVFYLNSSRLFSIFLLFSLVILLRGCAKEIIETPKPPPPVFEKPHAYQPHPHAYSLSQDKLVSLAAEYAQFLKDASAYTHSSPNSGSDLDQTLKQLSAHNANKFGNTFLAYVTMIAVNQKNFSKGVLEKAGEMGRNAFIARIYHDPDFIKQISGYTQALSEIHQSVSRQIHTFRSAGHQYKSYAYSLQKKAWAKKVTQNKKDRLTYLRYPPTLVVSKTALSDIVNGNTFHRHAQSTVQKNAWQQSINTDYKAYDMTLGLAALWLVDALDPGMNPYITSILGYYNQKFCFSFARKNLAQCIAAGHFKYEDAYCIAEHIFNDSAKCLEKVAN